MRFEGNSRGISRTDYQQFADFLGLSQPRCSKINPSAREEAGTKKSHPVGMVYGVEQEYIKIYDPQVGLDNGTIFEELNLPFYPVGCGRKNREGCL